MTLNVKKVQEYLDYFAQFDTLHATVMKMRIKAGDLIPVDDNGHPVQMKIED